VITPIYISGYPKPGNTWLTRLVGDCLNCPTGGSTPEQDRKEIATEGLDRPGPWVVRKGHFRLMHSLDGLRRVVPQPHVLAYHNLTKERVIFILRHPADIAVSGAHHWKVSLDTFIYWMITGTGGVRHCGRWNDYVEEWLAFRQQIGFSVVTYEGLHSDPEFALTEIFAEQELPYRLARVRAAIGRQSFENRRRYIEQAPESELRLGRKHQLYSLRKGVVGDWHNHFNAGQIRTMQSAFGQTMQQLGYRM